MQDSIDLIEDEHGNTIYSIYICSKNQLISPTTVIHKNLYAGFSIGLSQ